MKEGCGNIYADDGTLVARVSYSGPRLDTGTESPVRVHFVGVIVVG